MPWDTYKPGDITPCVHGHDVKVAGVYHQPSTGKRCCRTCYETRMKKFNGLRVQTRKPVTVPVPAEPEPVYHEPIGRDPARSPRPRPPSKHDVTPGCVRGISLRDGGHSDPSQFESLHRSVFDTGAWVVVPQFVEPNDATILSPPPVRSIHLPSTNTRELLSQFFGRTHEETPTQNSPKAADQTAAPECGQVTRG